MLQLPVQGGHKSMEVSMASTVSNPKVCLVPSFRQRASIEAKALFDRSDVSSFFLCRDARCVVLLKLFLRFVHIYERMVEHPYADVVEP
jgi:hypothetical protein